MILPKLLLPTHAEARTVSPQTRRTRSRVLKIKWEGRMRELEEFERRDGFVGAAYNYFYATSLGVCWITVF
jgi:hypothetical protein